MIACVFHKGSGLGNQLHRYVMVRTLALDKGYEFGVIYPENFKGKDFMDLDMGVPVKNLLYEYNEEKEINEEGNDVRGYDWDGILDIKDFTLIDGEFQGEKYYEHYIKEIPKWLNVNNGGRYYDMFTCIIGFRGGEYVGVPDLFLPKEYWTEAIAEMKRIEPNMRRFVVHTDDPITAKEFFPDFEIVSDVEKNWKAIRMASYLIISNSSFYILPSLLNILQKKIIAPKYWAGHNKGYWQLEQNQYEKFTYIL